MLKLQSIDGKYNGLEAKIKFIQDCYRKSLLAPALRSRLEEIAGRGSRMDQARRLYDWMKSHISYMMDPVGVEMTKSPTVLMKEVLERGSAYGDCDDQACFAFAALRLIGIPARLRVIWLSGPMPVHIYIVAYIDGQEVPFDTTRERGFGPGTEVRYSKKMDY